MKLRFRFCFRNRFNLKINTEMPSFRSVRNFFEPCSHTAHIRLESDNMPNVYNARKFLLLRFEPFAILIPFKHLSRTFRQIDHKQQHGRQQHSRNCFLKSVHAAVYAPFAACIPQKSKTASVRHAHSRQYTTVTICFLYSQCVLSARISLEKAVKLRSEFCACG